MRIAKISIQNFRGISNGTIFLNGNSVIIGDNNAGKSTIFEAIDLVLGPDRLNRIPVIDEHDFYEGKYYNPDGNSPKIEIELAIIDLEESQINRFKNNLHFWDAKTNTILPGGSIDSVDSDHIKEALCVKFVGSYDPEEDDFEGNTFFTSFDEEETMTKFSKSDKRECGFLYLRALRTGARALSMERGSLLDIILKLREIRPKMWENVLEQLRDTEVATDPELGIKAILEGVQDALKEFVPSDWGSEPILKVSDLTREHLRKTLTIFMSTGSGTYHAPFQHQGTGTINTMVLALLSMIAEAKKNVIFAMEEPEIAIPPYTQKRIIHSISKKSTQALFTSHSPFVLEEFPPDNIILIKRRQAGMLESKRVYFPKEIKPKSYNQEFRLRFSEALLAKRVLLTEGATEASAYSAAGRKLNELAPAKYASLEEMGIAIFNVMSETSISRYGDYFRNLGKAVFAVFDKQTEDSLKAIQKAVDHPFEAKYKGFEDLLTTETDINVIKPFLLRLVENDEWPQSLSKSKPEENDTEDDLRSKMKLYLIKGKGASAAADLIGSCDKVKQIPESIRGVLQSIKSTLDLLY